MYILCFIEQKNGLILFILMCLEFPKISFCLIMSKIYARAVTNFSILLHVAFRQMNKSIKFNWMPTLTFNISPHIAKSNLTLSNVSLSQPVILIALRSYDISLASPNFIIFSIGMVCQNVSKMAPKTSSSEKRLLGLNIRQRSMTYHFKCII